MFIFAYSALEGRDCHEPGPLFDSQVAAALAFKCEIDVPQSGSANAVLDIVANEDLAGKARDTGAYLQSRMKAAFAQVPIVGEVRGVGMLAAIEFVADREKKIRFDAGLKVGARVSKAARDRGLIARAMPHGDILGFAPPLVTSWAEIDEIVDIAEKAVRQVMDELAAGK
jgi:L-2,4-diaminobutyrate transaminase